MGGYCCGNIGKGLPLGKVRHVGKIVAVLMVGFCFQRQTVAAFQVFPPGTKHRFSLCRKVGIRTGKYRRYRFINVRLGGSEQQTRSGKDKDISLAFGKYGKVCLCKLLCRDNGVVV